MRLKVLHIILLIWAPFIIAQTPVITQISEFDGLPDSEIYDLIEDQKGYVWIAANKGLYRYDGKTFQLFTNQTKRGLSVFGLQEDAKGTIWCNNISGQFFYVKNNELILFIDLNQYIHGQLSEFLIFNNKLLALTEKGVISVDITTKKTTLFPDSTLESKMFGNPFVYNNEFYFSHGGQIRKLQNNSTTNGLNLSKSDKIKFYQTFGNEKDKFVIVISDKNEIFKLNGSKNTCLILPEQLEKSTIVRCILHKNQFWFATNKGVIVCEEKNNQLIYKDTYLKEYFFSKIIIDKNENIWMSSTQKGLFVIPNLHIQKLNDLPNNITCLAKLNTTHLAFGCNNSTIGIQNISTNKTTLYTLPITKKVTKLLLHEKSNCLLISSEENGFILNLNNGICYTVPELGFAKDLCWLNENTIIKCVYNTSVTIQIPILNTIQSNFKTSTSLTFSKDKIQVNTTTIRAKRSYTCASKNNNTYIGFVDELMLNNTKPIKYNSKSIFATDIENTQHNIWLSTFENGVFQIDQQKVIQHINTTNGLLSNYVTKLKSDKNLLWIATDKGLQLYDETTKSFKNILKNDGLETYDYTDLEIIGTKLFLLSNKGLYVIDTQKVFKKINTPNVYIQNIYCNNSKIAFTKNVFSPEENSFKIEFNTTGFQHESFVNFEYRLKGNSNDWIALEKGVRKLYFNQLNDGKYVLELRLKDENNQYSEIVKYEFEIQPPFWKRTWFIILCLVTLGLLTYFYFRYRIKKAENFKQKELEAAYAKQELIYSQLENLRSQMNPHFIFNALNSIQEFIISNEKEVASEYLVKFSRLIRIYLEHSREQEVLLSEEIKALKIYLDLEKIRFEDKLEYEIDCSKEIENQVIYLPSLFIQPYVENALKHGLLHKKTDRKLNIQFKIENKILAIKIEDNGIGITEAMKIKQLRNPSHQSFATSANQKRIQLLNQNRKHKIEVHTEEIFENEDVKGTCVTLLIPIEI